MPRPPTAKTAAKHSSTANLGFEAKLWLAADSRSVAKTAEANRSHKIDAAELERSGDSQPQAARRVSAANQYFLTQPSEARSTMSRIARRVPRRQHQFYTPSSVVRLLVEMLAPFTALRRSTFRQSEPTPQVVSAEKDNGRIYDPASGSSGSLPAFRRLRRMRFAVKDRAIAPGGVQSHGQEKWARRQQPKQSNATTRRLAIMNLAILCIEADFGHEHADTFRRDLHSDLRAKYVLATFYCVIANPPFSLEKWGGDVLTSVPYGRSFVGMPPGKSGGYAFEQHMIKSVTPETGRELS